MPRNKHLRRIRSRYWHSHCGPVHDLVDEVPRLILEPDELEAIRLKMLISLTRKKPQREWEYHALPISAFFLQLYEKLHKRF